MSAAVVRHGFTVVQFASSDKKEGTCASMTLSSFLVGLECPGKLYPGGQISGP